MSTAKNGVAALVRGERNNYEAVHAVRKSEMRRFSRF
jgi:hypothetical protein